MLMESVKKKGSVVCACKPLQEYEVTGKISTEDGIYHEYAAIITE